MAKKMMQFHWYFGFFFSNRKYVGGLALKFVDAQTVIVEHFQKNCRNHHIQLSLLVLSEHCVKRVQIRNYFWSEYRKIWTRNNSVLGQFSRGGI